MTAIANDMLTARSVMGRAVPRLASRVVRRRQWYIYSVGALLYASAMWLGQTVLFLIGTVIITIAIVVGEVDRKAERKAALREAQERRQ